MKSIKGQLLIGLCISGFIGAVALTIIVLHQYGLIGDTPPPFEQAWPEIKDHVIIPFVIFILLFGAGAYWVINRVEHKLTRASKNAMTAADTLKAYQTPVADLPLEVRPFAEAVNHLTLKLSSHAARQEAFAADAAHELKTPLAILALELDKLPEKDAVRLGEQMQGLSEMIDQLLILARSNSPDVIERQTVISPSDIARKLVGELAPTAIDRGKTLAFEDQASTEFSGLEEAVSTALRTITMNALRATPVGGEVTILTGPGPQFTVLDGGLGLDSLKLDHLKARGKRSDQAPGGAAGLGLAIADRIVEAHGGELLSCLPDKVGIKLDFSNNEAA